MINDIFKKTDDLIMLNNQRLLGKLFFEYAKSKPDWFSWCQDNVDRLIKKKSDRESIKSFLSLIKHSLSVNKKAETNKEVEAVIPENGKAEEKKEAKTEDKSDDPNNQKPKVENNPKVTPVTKFNNSDII